MTMATTTRPRTDRSAARASEQTRVSRRAARLEALLGDPYSGANPHGLAALFAADRRREAPRATERLLAGEGLGAELVPVAYGGRLLRADLLGQVLRPVFRRDAALGLGAGVASLSASSAVWAAGSRAQRRTVADLLLGGGRVAAVRAAGTRDGVPPGGGCTAEQAPDGGFRLSGRGLRVLDASRAGAHVVHARTGAQSSQRGRSVLLVDGARSGGAARLLPRARTSGMRGALLCGVAFDGCLLGADALVGGVGAGPGLARQADQLARCLVSGGVVAAVGTVLGSAVRAACAGRPGGPAGQRRGALAGVFVDLLAADALVTTVLRGLSVLPGRCEVQAAALGALLPGLFQENLEELATVLGSRCYGTGGTRYGAYPKLVRDLPELWLGDTAAACRSVIVPRLGGLAARAWFAEEEPPPQLFRLRGELPPLGHRLPGPGGHGDFLAASLTATAGRLAGARRAGSGTGILGALADDFVRELRALREECARLPAASAGGPAGCALGERYALLLQAAAVLGVWEGQDGTDPFLAAPSWAVLALLRIGGRLGMPVPEVPGRCAAQVHDELVRRLRTGLSYDLYATELAG